MLDHQQGHQHRRQAQEARLQGLKQKVEEVNVIRWQQSTALLPRLLKGHEVQLVEVEEECDRTASPTLIRCLLRPLADLVRASMVLRSKT